MRRCRKPNLWFIGALAAATLVSSVERVSADPGSATHGALAGSEAPTTSRAPLQDEVDRLASWVKRRGGTLTASIVELEGRAELGAHDASQALNPASNMKVVTAAAALDILGPERTFRTEVHGKIAGDTLAPLVLRGLGDPSLTTASLWRLVHSLSSRGVTTVDGILVDQSHFDDQFIPPAFEQQPDEWASFRAPVAALSLNGNTVTLNVLARTQGEPASVWFDPPGFVHVKGSVRTTAPGTGQHVGLTMHPKGLSLTAEVGGRIAQGIGRRRFKRRVDDPRLLAGHIMAELLRREGITVRGDVVLGGEGTQSRITYVESEPLGVLVRALGKHSDNFAAEMLFKHLGKQRGKPATCRRGATEVEAFLRRIGALDGATRIQNGSGLFDANRLSARTLTRVLAYAAKDPKIGPDFMGQLAIGGVDGTLRRRFRAHPSHYDVRAKTGTLNRVISLSGYALSPSTRGGAAFSFIVEGIAGAHSETRKRIDRVVAAVAKRQRTVK